MNRIDIPMPEPPPPPLHLQIHLNLEQNRLRDLLLDGASSPPEEPVDADYFKKWRQRIQERTRL
ncbi:MAG: hypothetical protein HQL91_08110 [Magnetococcales bacterium]|nr:hypothetical protein [Magnetococcales bacterium]